MGTSPAYLGPIRSSRGWERRSGARDRWGRGAGGAGLKSAAGEGGDLDRDGPHYRRGFEAARAPAVKGKSYEEALDYLTRRHQISAVHSAFRRGYERGRQHRDSLGPTAGDGAVPS